jgi:hypothetical protein
MPGMRAAFFTIILMAACGGGSGNGAGTGPVTAEQAQDLCETDCQHNIDCGSGQDLASCTTDCVEDSVGWARADAMETIIECNAALACDASDDQCLLEVQPLAIHEAWETACRRDLATCLAEPADAEGICEVSPVSEDVGFVRFIAPAIVDEMIDCLGAADCTARQSCLSATFEAHNIPFGG